MRRRVFFPPKKKKAVTPGPRDWLLMNGCWSTTYAEQNAVELCRGCHSTREISVASVFLQKASRPWWPADGPRDFGSTEDGFLQQIWDTAAICLEKPRSWLAARFRRYIQTNCRPRKLRIFVFLALCLPNIMQPEVVLVEPSVDFVWRISRVSNFLLRTRSRTSGLLPDREFAWDRSFRSARVPFPLFAETPNG